MRQNLMSVVWWILIASAFRGIIHLIGMNFAGSAGFNIVSSMIGFFVLVFVFIPLAVYLAGKTDEYFGHSI